MNTDSPATHIATPLLTVEDLTVEYAGAAATRRTKARFKAVRGVSFGIRAGSIFGLVGESGCGKSSIARAIVQLQQPSSGVIRFESKFDESHEASKSSPKKQIQMVFQDSLAALSPRRRVGQSIAEPLDHFQIGPRQSRPGRVAELASQVGIDTPLLAAYPHQLSGGQRQRVSIARALAAEPELIIADESLSSLDGPTRTQILALIRALRDQQKLSFLLISHDLSVVRDIADDVGVMYLGHLVEMGPAAEVFHQPAHPYTRALLAAIPKALPGQRNQLQGLPGEPPSPLTPPPGCVFHSRCSQAMDTCTSSQPTTHVIQNEHSIQIKHQVNCFLHSE